MRGRMGEMDGVHCLRFERGAKSSEEERGERLREGGMGRASKRAGGRCKLCAIKLGLGS